MCWSTGRAPIAQPPGSETRASPKRASSGPSTRIEARIVLTSSYGASVVRQPASASQSHRLARRARPPRPSGAAACSMVATSCRCGTLSSAPVRRRSAAPRTGSAARRSWRRKSRPRPASGGRRGSEFVHGRSELALLLAAWPPIRRRQRLHRQRVDLLAHALAQRRVDELVTRDARLPSNAGRRSAHEMPAVAVDLDVLAGQAARR